MKDQKKRINYLKTSVKYLLVTENSVQLKIEIAVLKPQITDTFFFPGKPSSYDK